LPQLMNTREVAEYLRIKERKVYDLVRDKKIPCTRVTGKWLFPKHLIDIWINQATEFPDRPRALLEPPPPVVVGSHDPLLDWAVRESGCDLAMMTGGSLDGLRRLAAGEAAACGLHVYDGEHDTYNQSVVADACTDLDVVLIEWAWRDQGLVLASGNPLGIHSLSDVRDKQARLMTRQHEAGSQLLLVHLLSEAGLGLEELSIAGDPARSETDLGLAVLEGKADAGLCVATVAHQYRLDFVKLHRERYDLLVRRQAYFEAPLQKLLAFTAQESFAARVAEMAGYDASNLGQVVYNGG